MEKLLLLSLLISASMEQEVKVIQSISTNIGDLVLECQEEMEFKDEVIKDFLSFWHDRNQLRSQDLGCALFCVFDKLELMKEDGNVHAENAMAFSRAMGADDITSSKLLELFQLCKKATESIGEQCEGALEATRCFRYGIFQLHWAPENRYRNKTSNRASGHMSVEGSTAKSQAWHLPVPPAAARRSGLMASRIIGKLLGQLH